MIKKNCNIEFQPYLTLIRMQAVSPSGETEGRVLTHKMGNKTITQLLFKKLKRNLVLALLSKFAQQ